MQDLNLLYVFETLWRLRSVTRAAEELGLTQAAVSGALKRLRQQYGDRMFTSVGRKMEPTPFAEAISQQLLDAMSLVRASFRGPAPFDAASLSKDITIRTRDIGEIICLPRLLKELFRHAPKTNVRTVFLPVNDTLAGLARGHIDVALGYLPMLENDIHKTTLFSEHFVCAMRSDHPAARGELTLDTYLAQDHLLIDYSASGSRLVAQALNKAGAHNRIKVRLPHYLTALPIVMSSDLLWTLPNLLADFVCKHFAIVTKPLPLQLPEVEISVYWHDRFHADSVNKWLRNLIVELFRTETREQHSA